MTAIRAFLTVGAAALFLYLAAVPMFVNAPTTYSGVHLVRSGTPIRRPVIRVDAGSPAARAGLRTGEVISCMSLRDRETLLEIDGAPSPYVPNRSLSLCARRNGVWQPFTIRPERRAAPGLFYGSVWFTVLRVAVFAVFLIVGILLVMARPSPLTWIFFAYCLGSVPNYAAGINDTVFPPVLYAVATGMLTAFVQVASGIMLIFALVVPNDWVPGGWRRTATWIAAIVTAALFAYRLVQLLRPELFFESYLLIAADYTLTAAIVLVVSVRLATAHGEERARFAWAAPAIVVGIVIHDLSIQFISTGLLFDAALFGVLTIITPVALMYAILKRHVIDVRFVISRTVVYAAITTFVIGIIGLVDWATSVYLQQARAAMAIDALVTIALGFALHRTYRWLERSVDVLLFRRKYEAAAYLHRLGRTLLRAKREETIDRAAVHDSYEQLHLTMAALFRAENSAFALSCAAGWNHPNVPVFDVDHDVIRFLMTERKTLHLSELPPHVAAQLHDGEGAPTIVIPVFEGDELFAFVLFGLHRDGTKLDPDEVQTLETLCEMVAQGYARVENLRYRELTRGSSTPWPAAPF